MLTNSLPSSLATVVGASLLLLHTLPGCGSGDSNTTPDSGVGGAGGQLNVGGNDGGSTFPDGGGGASNGCGSTVKGTVRDFRAGHPDFQCSVTAPPGFQEPYAKDCGPWDPAIVGKLGAPLGPDRKPTYAAVSSTPSSSGPKNFEQWFRDTPGVNASADLLLKLTAGAAGTYAYDSDRFFPIDGQLLAAAANDPDKGLYKDDDGVAHNFHFTYELHTTFRFDKGNVFTFRGDDDVFVFIADKLVINLGGIHVPLQGRIALDTGRVEITAPTGAPDLQPLAQFGLTESIPGGVAGVVPLSLTPGQVYAMDFFFAERNCCASNFRLETNFVFIDCGSPVK